MSKKEWALQQVTYNWRIRRRLPRLTALAVKLGLFQVRGPDDFRNADRAENDYSN